MHTDSSHVLENNPLTQVQHFYAYSDTMVLLDDNVQNPHSQTIKF